MSATSNLESSIVPAESDVGDPTSRATTADRAPAADALAQLIVQRVWLHVRRRKAWLDSLPKQISAANDADFFTDPDDPIHEERWSTDGKGGIWQEPIRQLDAQLDRSIGNPLHHLAETFGLSQPELDLLQTCVAHQLDPTLGSVFAYLHGQNQSGFVSGPLVKRLFRHASNSFWHPQTNLGRWKLVHVRDTTPGEPSAFVADAMLAPWLEGRLVLDPVTARLVRPVPVHPPLESWPLAEAVAAIKRSAFHAAPVRLVVTGPAATGRSTFAAAAARELGIECVAVNTGPIAEDEWYDTFLRVQRFALLGRFGVIWTGSHTNRPWPRGVDAALVHVITCEPEQDVTMPGWSDCRVELPSPSLAEKRTVWRRACPTFDQWSDDDRVALTQSYELSAGQISAIARMEPASGTQAIAFARDITRQNLGNLGQFLPCPFTWTTWS